MLKQREFNRIYTAYHDYGYLQLLFYSSQNSQSLLFDGLNFLYKSIGNDIPSGFQEIKEGLSSSGSIYEIESIKQSDDITFIKFSNGDIFQIHTMPSGNDGFEQVLSVFTKEKDSRITTPMGISSYDAALKRLSNAEDCEIEQ